MREMHSLPPTHARTRCGEQTTTHLCALDWELSLLSFSVQADGLTMKPHWPGLVAIILMSDVFFLPLSSINLTHSLRLRSDASSVLTFLLVDFCFFQALG